MNAIHLNGYTLNTAHITWITQQHNTLLIHFLMQSAPLQIPFRSADDCTRAHRELLQQLEQRP